MPIAESWWRALHSFTFGMAGTDLSGRTAVRPDMSFHEPDRSFMGK